MNNSPLPRRKWLHETPTWVRDAIFFVTQCCQRRGGNQLCIEPASGVLLDAAEFYHQAGKWFVFTMVLMPDHVHALISIPDSSTLTEMWAGWKRFTARRAKIEWQRGFFEHRLRGDEGWEQKSDYIRQNPVRAGLVADAEEWPHVIGWNGRDRFPNRPCGERTPGTGVPTDAKQNAG